MSTHTHPDFIPLSQLETTSRTITHTRRGADHPSQERLAPFNPTAIACSLQPHFLFPRPYTSILDSARLLPRTPSARPSRRANPRSVITGPKPRLAFGHPAPTVLFRIPFFPDACPIRMCSSSTSGNISEFNLGTKPLSLSGMMDYVLVKSSMGRGGAVQVGTQGRLWAGSWDIYPVGGVFVGWVAAEGQH